MKLHEGLHRRQVVDVHFHQLVPNGFQGRVVQLEEAHLHALRRGDNGGQIGGFVTGKVVVLGRHPLATSGRLQRFQDVFRAQHQRSRHARQASHMDAKAVVAAAWSQLAEEDHLAVHLLHAHVHVHNPRQTLAHVVELVIMRGEQRQGAVLAGLVQMLGNGPCDADAIVRAGAAPNLIQQHQAARREVVEDGRGFVHLHHEGGFAAADVVRRANPGENPIEDAQIGVFGGDKRARLRHQGDQRGLPQQGTLARHVGPCDHQDLSGVRIELDVVGDVGFARGQLPFDDGMPAL